MSESDKVIPFKDFLASGGRRYQLREDHQRVVTACRHEVATTCSGLLERFFGKLDDVLFKLSQKTAGISSNPDYFSAMRELRLRRSAIAADFLGEVLQGYDRFWKLGPGVRAADPRAEAEMELLEQEELDESLAVSDIVSRAERQYHDDLVALDRRFSYMLQGAPVGRETNPIAPATLTRAFERVLAPVTLDLAVKLIGYKLFDTQVMHHLGGLYQEVNSRLDHGDILPGLTSKKRNDLTPRVRHFGAAAPAVAHAVGPAGEPTAPQESGASTHEPLDPAVRVYRALRALLHECGRREQPVAQTRAREEVQLVTTTDLLGVLSDMQRSALALGLSLADPVASARSGLLDDLKKVLKLGQAGEPRRSLEDADLDTIDVISMLFDFIVNDRSIPDAMKALLIRLQIPMLKVALLDRGFFRNKTHPARLLLNQLSQVAFAWTDDGDRSEASLYGRVESIVSRVVVEFETDPGVFEALNRELSDYVHREQQSARMTEERTRQVSRGKEQLRTARRRVDREIDWRLSQRAKVPDVVYKLLVEAWKDVLLLAYLRQGPDSLEWRNALGVVDKLLWSLEPRSDPAERQQLLQAIPTLLDDLRTGLTGIAYDHNRMARLFKDLQALHIICLRGKPGDAPVRLIEGKDNVKIRRSDIAALEDAIVGRGPIPPHPEETTDDHPPNDQFLRMAADLPVGSWLDMQETNGRRSRVKLSWKSEDSDLFVFVNRKGIKVAEMTANMLASLLSRSAAEVLDVPNEPLMDRALASMIDRLEVAQ